ncbi:MAG: response regulator [Patescibacteria group bacterium]
MGKSDLRKVVLSVNNDKIKQDIIKRSLSCIDTDIMLIQAFSGLEALTLLCEERVDLVMTALSMPWMSGLDFIRCLRDPELGRLLNISSLPVMVVSTTPLREADILDYSINDYLMIPASREIFLEKVTALLSINK